MKTLSELVQPARILFLQIQLPQRERLLIDFRDLRARACVAEMSDLDFATENLLREELTSEIKNLPDHERFITHHCEAMVAHVHNHARKPGFSGIQRPPPGHRNPRLSTQFTRFHRAPSC